MKIIEERRHPGLAALYLACLDEDGDQLIEFVDTLEPGVPKTEKWVMMLSTQIGCPVGCRMCDAGSLGYRGNLSAGQILEQLRFIVSRNPGLDLRSHPKIKIHFARMGEPSLNPEVLKALELLSAEFPHPGILPSLSTVAPKSPAIRPFFDRLIEVKNAHFPNGKFQLQFSLHATDVARRRQIVPITMWNLEEVAGYGARFHRPGDRKITLNFALAEERDLDPDALSRVFSPDLFLIKITPVNPTAVSKRNGSTHLWTQTPLPIERLAVTLRSKGFEVILSPSLPEEIEAQTSCGQLWSEKLKEKSATLLRNRKREKESYIASHNLKDKAEIWQREIRGFQRHRGTLCPERAGLLVVDMQEFFLDPQSPAYRPSARAILGNTRRLVEVFREIARPVIFILHAQERFEKDAGLMELWWRKVCWADSRGARIPAFLGARDGEIFRKCRYSAFTNPSLAGELRSQGVEEIVVAGVMTNLCVESTVRDAFDSGFQTFVVLDATAAHTEAMHLASLKNLAFGFSTVQSTEETLRALQRESASGAKPSGLIPVF
ncbi:MAG: isochorismatase family protein [Elusimicrobia bacterium]|nr:isochorismatase family protein [Elusimicrobiota bacterium]